MTDRHDGYLVILEKAIREDDAEPTITALEQIRGVLKVEPCISTSEGLVNGMRVKCQLLMKLQGFVSQEWRNES